MAPNTVRIWKRVHTWTSLVCTLFLLILCVTGLPLVFQEDIDQAFGQRAGPDPAADAAAPHLDLDRLIAIARAAKPNEALRFATAVRGKPLWNMEMGTTVESMKLT